MFLARGPVLPYNGIVFFFVLPGVFVLGLLLMPIGGLLRRRRLKKEGKLPHVYPTIDLHQPVLQRALLWIAALSFVNFSLMGMATYKAIEHMDSVEFCGTDLPSVMAPEYTAYLNSPHSRVACVECHIGSGAPWFVKAKISGMRQLFAVNLKTYSRPIPSPVENLRPARDTCEHCHWPERFTGDKLLVKTKYADDEQNTPATTVLLMKIGGRTTPGHGRHPRPPPRSVGADRVRLDRRAAPGHPAGHVHRGRRQEGRVRLRRGQDDAGGAARRPSGGRWTAWTATTGPRTPSSFPSARWTRRSRPGASTGSSPSSRSRRSRSCATEYPDRGTAAEKIPQAIADFYKTKYPDVYQSKRPIVETAAQQVAAIYLRNVFPEMKLTWGTHPNNIGHDDFLGCFRCHDGKHKTADGQGHQRRLLGVPPGPGDGGEGPQGPRRPRPEVTRRRALLGRHRPSDAFAPDLSQLAEDPPARAEGAALAEVDEPRHRSGPQNRVTRRRWVTWLLGTSVGAHDRRVPLSDRPIPGSAGGLRALADGVRARGQGLRHRSRTRAGSCRSAASPCCSSGPPAGELKALTAKCTHLDCTVQYRAERSDIWCACHNGTYDTKGIERLRVRLRGR